MKAIHKLMKLIKNSRNKNCNKCVIMKNAQSHKIQLIFVLKFLFVEIIYAYANTNRDFMSFIHSYVTMILFLGVKKLHQAPPSL